MSIAGEIAPFYFGTPDRELFGCLHIPEADKCRDCGVLICQPLGHEYVNCHRALRQLAQRLVDAGFPVLRFDYYGCGDSRGDTTVASVSEWIDNISQAIFEIQQRVEVPKICLLGLRLGGSLAMLNARRWERAHSLVLWDPVIDGCTYIKELMALEKEMRRFRPRLGTVAGVANVLDIFGFPMTEELCRSICEIDLLQRPRKVPERVLLIETSQPTQQLASILTDSGAAVRQESLEAPNIWLPTPDGSLVVPSRVLQRITSWLIERYA